MHRLFAAGIILILVGFVLLAVGSSGQGGGSVGGVVFIGPLPIVFGSGPSGWPLAIASLLIGVVMLAFLLVWGVRLSRLGRV